MSQIKVSELFYSMQGEGRFMGVPSIFLRTYGCNFTCAGFGMEKGKLSIQANAIAANSEQYPTYDSLPLVTTGCDSYASWHPKFKHLSPTMTIDEIANRMIELLPNNSWEGIHLVITGGEPLLLGWQKLYPQLLDHPLLSTVQNITFETNGTQRLSKEFLDYLYYNNKRWVTFSVSPKLSVSGEPAEKAIVPDAVVQYKFAGSDVYLKFVIATEEDANEALEKIELYKAAGFNGHVYLMPVGGVEAVYNLNNRAVADLALKHGLRYSDRLQVPLFKNEWAT
jgi:organic radical activating enzyme